MTSIVFIGGGNMASCLVGGMLNSGFTASQITVCEPNAAARESLKTRFGVNVSDTNRSAAAQADLIILAVKPQVMHNVAVDLAPAMEHSPLIISIAAGIPIAALQYWLGSNKFVVRAMPNTPAMVKKGATGLYATPEVSVAQKELVDRIFSGVGIAHWLAHEDLIDTVTALSGSGPAYFFLLMELMQKAGEDLGLDRETARALTLQTALGAATMAGAQTADAARLRQQVTSPGGTTERAILSFQKAGLEKIVREAMQGAKLRAAEMAAEFSR